MFNNVQLAKGNLNAFLKNNFVELIDPLNRSSGRKIYIAKAEEKAYKDILKSRGKDFNHFYLYKQIVSLKNQGYVNSLVSKVCMNSCKLPLEGGEIIYGVWYNNIYINQIKVQADYRLSNNKVKVSAGVYQVRKVKRDKDFEWEVDGVRKGIVKQEGFVNTKNLAINGGCNGIMDAASYMPAFVRHGHGESALNNVYALFFNPGDNSVGSGWRSLKDSAGLNGGTQAAQKLATVLMRSTEKNLNITVQGSGHSLFKQALRIVSQSNHSLKDMTVFYANASENLNLLDGWRKKTGMKLAQKSPLNNSASVRQYLTSGNLVSQVAVAHRANAADAGEVAWNAVAGVLSTIGLGTLGSSIPSIPGVAGWVMGAIPLVLSQSPELDKRVIIHPFQSAKQGGKQYWDSLHKMLVKG